MADYATLISPPPKSVAVANLSKAERAGVYRWLSGLFAQEQTVDTLRHYRSGDGRALLEALRGIAPLAPAAATVQLRVADVSDADLPGRARDLAGAFARLFLGVGGRQSAPPYQSFYTSSHGRLMQEPAAMMQAELRRRDTRLAEDFPEPPDHISVQLSVLAELVETASAAVQAEFLDARLLGWIGAFRDRCVEGDSTGFYAAAARSLVDFTHEDAAALRDADSSG